jgi:hypothetical protein
MTSPEIFEISSWLAGSLTPIHMRTLLGQTSWTLECYCFFSAARAVAFFSLLLSLQCGLPVAIVLRKAL